MLSLTPSRTVATAAGLALVGPMLAGSAFGQLRVPKPKISVPVPGAGSLIDKMLASEAPLSTKHDDMDTGLRTLDGWNPATREMTDADRTGGEWRLAPGNYRFALQSFCGRGGANGPFRGLGYGMGRYRGSQVDAIRALVRGYERSAGVSQRDAQLVIWSVLARVKPSKMDKAMRGTLAKLLTAKQISKLEGVGLDALKEDAMERVRGRVSETLRPVYEAENSFRAMATRTGLDYDAAEAVMVPMDPTMRSSVPWGRWLATGRGYLVRYLPERYSLYHVEVSVPRRPEIARDAKGRITRMECPPGYVSEVTYADEVEPMRFPEYPGLAAYAIKRIRLTSPGENPGDPARTHTQNVEACILRGSYGPTVSLFRTRHRTFAELLGLSGAPWLQASLEPAYLGAPGTTGAKPGWFSGAKDSAKKGKDAYDDWQQFKKMAEREERIKNGKAGPGDFFDESHYVDGIKSAATGDGLKWMADHISAMREALAWETNQIGKLPGGEESEFDPTQDLAVPGNPGGQFGIISGKLFK